MAKKQSFSDKVKKTGMVFGKVCPTCGEVISYVRRVEPVKKASGSLGFKDTMVPICKCNIKEVQEA